MLRGLPLVRAADRDALIAALPRSQQQSAQRVGAWFGSRNTSTYFPDALAAVHYLKRNAAVRPEAIASVGFSLGGGVTALSRGAASNRGRSLLDQHRAVLFIPA